MASNTLSSIILLLTGLIAGLKKNQPNGSFVIKGVTYTTAQLVKMFQQILTAMAAVPPAKATYTKAVATSRSVSKQYMGIALGLKQILQVEYEPETDVLADYGLAPKKASGPTSPEVLVAASTKAKATRKARNTMGPKARLKVTGATVAPAAPAEPAAPAGAPTTPVVVPPGH